MQYVLSQTEGEFLRYFNKRCLMSDLLMMCFQFVAIPTGVFMHRCSPILVALFAVCWSYSVLLLYLIAFHSQRYVHHREGLVSLMQVLQYVVNTMYTPVPLAHSFATTSRSSLSPLSAVWHLLRNSKGFNLLFLAWVLPVRLKTHLYRGTIGAIIFAATSSFTCKLGLALEYLAPDDVAPPPTWLASYFLYITSWTVDPELLHAFVECSASLMGVVWAAWLLSAVTVGHIEYSHRKAFGQQQQACNTDYVINLWPTTGLQLILADCVAFLVLCMGCAPLWDWLGSVGLVSVPAGAVQTFS